MLQNMEKKNSNAYRNKKYNAILRTISKIVSISSCLVLLKEFRPIKHVM